MKILDIALKDLIRSMRSLFLVGMAFAAPLLITALIYFSFGSIASGNVDMPTINVGVVNLDVLPANSLLEAPLGEKYPQHVLRQKRSIMDSCQRLSR
jgi:hypothetical protein